MLFVQAIVDGLLLGGVYALAALGLSLIFGVMKITNFAHGSILAVGMFFSYQLWESSGGLVYSMLPVVVAFMFCLGYVLHRFFIHKASQTKGYNQLLITMGFSVLLENLILVIWTADYKHISVPGFLKSLSVAELMISKPKLVAFCIVAFVAIAVYWLLFKTDMGKAIRAISMDVSGSVLCGINIKNTNAIAFGVGTACAGIAGALLAPAIYIYPAIGSIYLLKCFVISVLGGLGDIRGALFAGLIVGVVEGVSSFLLGGTWSEMVIYSIFVLVLIFKPTGLLGRGAGSD